MRGNYQFNYQLWRPINNQDLYLADKPSQLLRSALIKEES